MHLSRSLDYVPLPFGRLVLGTDVGSASTSASRDRSFLCCTDTFLQHANFPFISLLLASSFRHSLLHLPTSSKSPDNLYAERRRIGTPSHIPCLYHGITPRIFECSEAWFVLHDGSYKRLRWSFSTLLHVMTTRSTPASTSDVSILPMQRKKVLGAHMS